MPAKQRKSSSRKIDDQELRLFVREHPDAYLREIAEQFGTTLEAEFYGCKRLKISLKKDPLLREGIGEKKRRIHTRARKNS